jgi:SAM-dependent methyltransferase
MSIADVGTLKAYPARPKRRTVGRSLRAVLRRLRWGLSLGLVKAAFYVAKSGGRPYEPVEIGGRRFANVRDSDVRWRAIATVLKQFGVRNVLDVGCAEGWFIRRAASDLHCFAVGIEASDCMAVGELSRLYDRAERMATIRSFVGPKDLLALPKFDAVICMSVVHHIIRAYGLATAGEFVTALVSRVNKVLIFEVGTAEESSWTEFLPELSQGHEVFVRDFLERCGLRDVRVIAESPSYHREVQRLLFVAEPRQTGDTKLAGSELHLKPV